MRVNIAKRSYPMNVTGVLKKPILLKAYSDFLKSRYADELLDYVFCTVVQKKSPHFMYWNFIHDTAKKQVNLGAHGTNLREPIEAAINAPDKVDMKGLKESLAAVYSHVVNMLDQNFKLAFSKSTQLEDFALAQVRLKPRDALTKLDVSASKYAKYGRTIVLHLAFGRTKEAKIEVEKLLKKATGKKPTSKAMIKHMKALEKAL